MKRLRIAVVLCAAALAMAACTAPPGPGGGTTTTTTAPPSGEPVAIASGAPVSGIAPLTVSFSSAGSLPGSGTGLVFSWDFGDGNSATGPSAQHTYTTPGTYQARLTISGSQGSDESNAVTISVNADPEPKFHVSANGIDSADCGPVTDPCATIQEAQALAGLAGIDKILVTVGNFQGPVVLESNMDIEGGYELDFSDTSVDSVTSVTGTATAPAFQISGVSNSTVSGLDALGVTRTSGEATGINVVSSNGIQIGDLEAVRTRVSGGQGPHATGVKITGSQVVISNADVNSGTPDLGGDIGSTAYGVRALQSSTVRIENSRVEGQPGTDGTGSVVPPPARPDGCNGGTGENAGGPRDPGNGGSGGSCGAAQHNGGSGGKGAKWGGAIGAAPADAGSGGSGPEGGSGGEKGGSGCCTDPSRPGGGGGGGGGNAGAAGQAGGNVIVSADVWTPTNAGNGGNGGHGSGGGGGGGGGSASASGGGGGGGGTGGNGGAGGTDGGFSGGSSFGLYSDDSTVSIINSHVTAAKGGNGGAGQPGGRGGHAGDGGESGSGSCCKATGGGGGGGGGGGAGGGGRGGGAGGHSIAIVNVGSGVLFVSSGSTQARSLETGEGGAGGAGGPGGDRGAAGEGNDKGPDGASGSDGATGQGGPDGPDGLRLRIWNNGITTP